MAGSIQVNAAESWFWWCSRYFLPRTFPYGRNISRRCKEPVLISIKPNIFLHGPLSLSLPSFSTPSKAKTKILPGLKSHLPSFRWFCSSLGAEGEECQKFLLHATKIHKIGLLTLLGNLFLVTFVQSLPLFLWKLRIWLMEKMRWWCLAFLL